METKVNDVIFRQGDEARDFYGLIEGEVELSLVFKEEFLRLDIRYEESIVAKREIIEKPIGGNHSSGRDIRMVFGRHRRNMDRRCPLFQGQDGFLRFRPRFLNQFWIKIAFSDMR